jgi:hypothetical protein
MFWLNLLFFAFIYIIYSYIKFQQGRIYRPQHNFNDVFNMCKGTIP